MGDTVTADADDVTALLLALVSIANDSQDADIVRLAMVALYETAIGREFMSTNPIEVK
ncbi:hypothetical protein SEA_STEAMEDHAMS_56 [Gordonia phage SteamedHams]|nr:hypothetical protein SEA_STEAMEDHAMS_56 [Gordonia phage SteamedHams]QGJ94519.1 hypothetical protein PBI_ANDPEGGY_52 [Gordonia phage AndPeggy]QGJ96006.1 hypothetical protein PBI_YARN_52 [Gordonia phage Yarn]QWY82480.1 hypothetical protein SEA_TOLLS_56 [Gordonia phage Tolls]